MFRKDREWLGTRLILERVAAAWGVDVDALSARRRGWEGKGVAAYFLVKYGGLTRRACAPLIGLTSGMGVGYQILKVVKQMETDPVFARRIAKMEAQLEK